jgi:hypothetical protein
VLPRAALRLAASEWTDRLNLKVNETFARRLKRPPFADPAARSAMVTALPLFGWLLTRSPMDLMFGVASGYIRRGGVMCPERITDLNLPSAANPARGGARHRAVYAIRW